MAGYNRIILMGNLTRDPEYKQLTSGQAVCRLGLASNRQFKNRQTGSMVQEVCYIDVDVWGAQAESCKQYLQKGRPVLIEGRLKFDSWKDAEGQTRSKHAIVADRVLFLSGANSADVHNVEGEFGASDESSMSRLDPNNPAEKELMDQIDAIKGRAKKKATPAKKDEVSGSDFAFNDEPPFQDDLPF